MNGEEIVLGSTVKDTITGYEGVAVTKSVWLNGCVRYAVQAPVQKDGKLPDALYFDEQHLKVLKPAKPKQEYLPAPRRGGPQQDEKHRRDR